MGERRDLGERAEDERHLVIVPAQPGSLRTIGGPTRRERDEIDDILDEVFGASGSEKPTAFDAVLICGGLALIVASWAAKLSAFLMALGWMALVLGLVLPARALVGSVTGRRRMANVRRQVAGATVLDPQHPVMQDLIDAYGRLEALVASRQFPLCRAAFQTAHMALIEVATLLRGRTPSTPSEIEYVDSRARALTELSAHLERETAPQESARDVTDAEIREAIARELKDMEERGGWSSLAELRSLNEALEKSRTT